MIGHGFRIVSLVGQNIAEGQAQLLSVQQTAPQDRLEKRIDGARLSTWGHPWLLHTRISKRWATQCQGSENAGAGPDGRSLTQPVSPSFIGPRPRKVGQTLFWPVLASHTSLPVSRRFAEPRGSTNRRETGNSINPVVPRDH